MKAKKTPIEKVKLDDMKFDEIKSLEILQVSEPVKRKGGVMVSSVDELLDKLRNEAKVL